MVNEGGHWLAGCRYRDFLAVKSTHYCCCYYFCLQRKAIISASITSTQMPLPLETIQFEESTSGGTQVVVALGNQDHATCHCVSVATERLVSLGG